MSLIARLITGWIGYTRAEDITYSSQPYFAMEATTLRITCGLILLVYHRERGMALSRGKNKSLSLSYAAVRQ